MSFKCKSGTPKANWKQAVRKYTVGYDDLYNVWVNLLSTSIKSKLRPGKLFVILCDLLQHDPTWYHARWNVSKWIKCHTTHPTTPLRRCVLSMCPCTCSGLIWALTSWYTTDSVKGTSLSRNDVRVSSSFRMLSTFTPRPAQRDAGSPCGHKACEWWIFNFTSMCCLSTHIHQSCFWVTQWINWISWKNPET